MTVDRALREGLAAELTRQRRRLQKAQRDMDDCVRRARDAGVPWPIIAKAIDRSPSYLTSKYGKTPAQKAAAEEERIRRLLEKVS